MTAMQIIDEIKIMAPEERAQIVDFLRQMEKSSTKQPIDDRAVEEISDRIMDRHAELMRKLAS